MGWEPGKARSRLPRQHSRRVGSQRDSSSSAHPTPTKGLSNQCDALSTTKRKRAYSKQARLTSHSPVSASVSAPQHNANIQVFAARFKQAVKSAKVMIVSCRRPLPIIMNALLKTHSLRRLVIACQLNYGGSASRAHRRSTESLPGEAVNTPRFRDAPRRSFIHAGLQAYDPPNQEERQ